LVNPDLIVILVLVGLILVIAWSHGSWQRVLKEPAEPEPPALEPWPDDEYVICPVCHLMGRHSLEPVERPAREVIVGEDGEEIELIHHGGLSKFYVRTCAFYGDQHRWNAPYREE
jgi:hypothetical protein